MTYSELLSNSIHTFTAFSPNNNKHFFDSLDGHLNRQKILKRKIPKWKWENGLAPSLKRKIRSPQYRRSSRNLKFSQHLVTIYKKKKLATTKKLTSELCLVSTKWSNTRQKSFSICRKIFEIWCFCRHYVFKEQRNKQKLG